MSAAAVFIAPGGGDAVTAIRRELHALTTPTEGDLLHVGQIFRSRIRQRTFQGIDVNGAPFAPYSQRGPFYLYPNRESASGRTAAGKAARATAAKNRHQKTGRIGVRTATGIKYASYAAAKAAHGVATVNLYGMEQHTHMLDTMLVKCGGFVLDSTGEGLDFGSELQAFEQGAPASQLTLGFYGPEAERAKGHNEGTAKLPKREFFALNQEDLALGSRAIAERMMIRAKSGHQGPSSSGFSAPARDTGPITLEDVGF
jgi:hypothetical protein